MDTNKLRKVQLASIFIMVSFFVTAVLTATGGVVTPQVVTQSDSQVVGVFGNQSDSAINLGMEAYLDAIDTDFEVLSFSQIQQFRGQVVIFAHGDEQGIRLSENLMFTWDAFSVLLSSAKAEKIFLASCFGANANNDKYSGPELISWDGYIDALLIGYIAAYYTLLDNRNSIDLVLGQIISRATLLVSKKAEPVYLAYTPPGGGGGGGGLGASESGYASAYKAEKIGSGITTGRRIWFNFDRVTGMKVLELHGGVAELVSAIAGSVIAAPIALGIILVLLANAILWRISEVNRIRHDFMIGVQAHKYLPLTYFLYHTGNDGYKINGIITIPQASMSGIYLYFGTTKVSSSWTPFNLQ